MGASASVSGEARTSLWLSLTSKPIQLTPKLHCESYSRSCNSSLLGSVPVHDKAAKRNHNRNSFRPLPWHADYSTNKLFCKHQDWGAYICPVMWGKAPGKRQTFPHWRGKLLSSGTEHSSWGLLNSRITGYTQAGAWVGISLGCHFQDLYLIS